MLDALPYAEWSEAQQLNALAGQTTQGSEAQLFTNTSPATQAPHYDFQHLDDGYGAFLAAPEPMSDSPSTDDIPGQNYTQEALLKAAEGGDYAKVVDLVTQNTSPIDQLMSGSRPMGEARALPGPDIWYDMLDTKYLGSYMQASISFADTMISGGEELLNAGGDVWNYAQGTNRSALTGEFMPASQLGMSIQTKGWGQTGLDLFSGIVHAPFEAAAGLYHNDPERVGAGLTFWAPALGVTSRFSRSSAPNNSALNSSSTWSGKQRFDATNLTEEQVKIATTKAIRRKLGLRTNSDGQLVTNAAQTEDLLSTLTTWRRNHYAADPDFQALDSNLQGTIIHSSVSNRVRQLNIQDLNVNQRLYGQSQYTTSPVTGAPYEYRIPDFYHTGTNAIFDIKPAGTPLSGAQYNDFRSFANTDDVRWIFYDNNF
ncbi:MAG: hypothetical protein ABW087_20160 [Candidatus Thiodiazotropha sp.]